MSDYILSCESAIDISPAMVEEFGLHYMKYRYELGTDALEDDLFQSIPYHEFYQRMLDGEMTKTYAMNENDYMEFFRPFLEEGKDILHVTLSTGLTSTYQNACLAKEELSEEYPNRKIYIVDGISACGGYGVLMASLSEIKKGGADIDTLYEKAEYQKMHTCHLFFSTDLTFYIRGGRISRTAGVFAQALNICPFCDMDEMGYLIVREKVRTKKKVKARMAERMAELAENGTDYDGFCFINHSDCKEDCEDVIALLEEKFPRLKGKIRMNPIGPTIGAHTGPGTVALFFTGAERFPSDRSVAAKNQE